MTIDDLIAAQQARINATMARQAAERAARELILSEATAAGAIDLDADQAARFDTHTAAERAAAGELPALEAKLAELREVKAEDEKAATLAEQTGRTDVTRPGAEAVVRVGQEARTYRPDLDKRGKLFLRDVARSFLSNDPEASGRLQRHMQEERVEHAAYLERAAGTGAFAGLVVPQYLTDLYAPSAKALRPFADVCTHHDLPSDGMTVNISRITTGTSVAAQSAENAAVSETNIDDTLLSPAVKTNAGQQTLSRQVIERGTGTEDVMLQDLFNAYATSLDSILLNEAATGLTNVATSVAYTDATPTAAELWPKILNGVANVEAALLGGGMATHAIMHSRRWAWMQSQVGTSWPFIAQPGIPTQAGGQNDATVYNSGVRGTLPNGLWVIVDNNIGTTLGAGTEDEIYVVAQNECHLWEDPSAPMLIRAEQPAAASLGVLFVVYGYFAYTFARYTSGTGKINGTGLIAPTF